MIVSAKSPISTAMECLNSRKIGQIHQCARVCFLTGDNTLRRHLHLLGLLDIPLCRRCGTEDETSAHILCECESLASLRHTYLGSWSQRTLREKVWGPSGTLAKQQAPINQYGAQRAHQLRPRCFETIRSQTQSQIKQSINEKWAWDLKLKKQSFIQYFIIINIPHGKIPTKSTYIVEVKTPMWCQQAHLLQDMLTASTHTAMMNVWNMWWTFQYLMFVDPRIIVRFIKKNPTRCNNVSKFHYSIFI